MSPTSPVPTTGTKPPGTQRKCANCGQVGHIKTNKKYVFTFHQCAFLVTSDALFPDVPVWCLS